MLRLSQKTILFIIFLWPGFVKALPVVNVSLNNGKQNAEIIFSSSEKFDYKQLILKEPNRFVVDFYNSELVAKDTMPFEDQLVKKIRIAENRDSVVRAAFDIKSEFSVLSEVLENKGKFKLVFKLKQLSVKNVVKKEKRKADKKSLVISKPRNFNYRNNFPVYIPSPYSYKRTKKVKSGKALEDFFRKIKVNNKPTINEKDFSVIAEDNDFTIKPVIMAKPFVSNLRKARIIIDPGHGGEDPGAISKGGTKEKDINLKYALTLKQKLEKTGRYSVFLTRASDRYVSLNERVKKARRARGDLFISLHADSHKNPDTRGLSVYTISDRRANYELNKLTNQSNKKEVISGVNIKKQSKDVRHLLIDMVQTNTQNVSRDFADILVEELGGNARLLDNPHRNAGFAVLTGIDMPSVLVELGYMSNRFEERLLVTTPYRNKLTSAVVRAINKYFEEYGLE